MTDTLTDELVLPEPRTFHYVRNVAAELEAGDDGRTVLGRMFPIGETAHVRELVDGELLEYDEQFLPGCTLRMRQARQEHRITLRIDHGDDFDAKVGYCHELDERGDGAYGTFRLYDDPVRIDRVRSMLTESHSGMSVQFFDVARPRIRGNVVGRVQIHISHVAATPAPVYPSAGVLAVRAEDITVDLGGTPNLDRVRAMLAELDLGE